jgi:glycosyltransferase involved in cell wall biosynthesis
MRILMFSDLYHPIIGGMERHVQTLSREFVRRGHHVAVATLAHEGSPEFEVDQGVHIYRLSGWNRALKPFYASAERQFHPTLPDPGVTAGLRRVLNAESPDIVHGRGWMLYSYLPLRSRYDVPLIVTLHDYSLVCPRRNFVHRGQVCSGPAYAKCVRCGNEQYGVAKSLLLTTGMAISKRAHNRVDQFISISQAVRDASVQAAGRPPRPLEVIPTFVPDSVLAPHTARERPAFLPPTDDYILFVGELSPHKGVQVLLDAYQGVADLAPLVLIGSQHGKSTIDVPAEVIVARNVPHEDVMAAWAHSAIGVVPSIWPEPFGQVAVEAMASRKPVVASAIGGLPDVIVDRETGLLVPPGDAVALRGALRELLLDPARRARMGEAGHERARLFTVGVVADRIEHVYRKALVPST